jgi:1-deoxy-D-xylulose-5-phosphate reductoisomerase
MRKRRVILLGSTGSIGTSAIKVAESIPDQMEIVGMAARQSAAALAESANRLRPPYLCLVNPPQLLELRHRLNYRPEIFIGEDGLETLARIEGADLVLVAIVGTAGLRPAMGAIETGKDLALASKEILVMAGEIVMQRGRQRTQRHFSMLGGKTRTPHQQSHFDRFWWSIPNLPRRKIGLGHRG